MLGCQALYQQSYLPSMGFHLFYGWIISHCIHKPHIYMYHTLYTCTIHFTHVPYITYIYHTLYVCVCVYHISYTYTTQCRLCLSIDKQLGWFHIMAIMNGVALTMGVQIAPWHTVSFPLYTYIFSGIAQSWDSYIFDLYGTSVLFSIAALLIYILTIGFPFLHVFASTCYLLSLSLGWDDVSLWFYLHFSYTYWFPVCLLRPMSILNQILLAFWWSF